MKFPEMNRYLVLFRAVWAGLITAQVIGFVGLDLSAKGVGLDDQCVGAGRQVRIEGQEHRHRLVVTLARSERRRIVRRRCIHS